MVGHRRTAELAAEAAEAIVNHEIAMSGWLRWLGPQCGAGMDSPFPTLPEEPPLGLPLEGQAASGHIQRDRRRTRGIRILRQPPGAGANAPPRPTDLELSGGRPLTPKALEVLRIVSESIRARGHAPSVAEIAKARNVKGSGSTHAILERLAEDGHIRKLPGKARAIEIVGWPDGGPGPGEDARGFALAAQGAVRQAMDECGRAASLLDGNGRPEEAVPALDKARQGLRKALADLERLVG